MKPIATSTGDFADLITSGGMYGRTDAPIYFVLLAERWKSYGGFLTEPDTAVSVAR